MPAAGSGRLVGRRGDLHRQLVAGHRRVEVAVGAPHLAEVLADPDREEPLAGRAQIADAGHQGLFGRAQVAPQQLGDAQVTAGDGVQGPLVLVDLGQRPPAERESGLPGRRRSSAW